MPQEPILLYPTGEGIPVYMHSVDAQEAVRLGDYRYATPEEERSSSPEKAAAFAAMRSTNATPHPELLSPEERQKQREEANKAEVARLEALGQPVPAALTATPAAAPAQAKQAASRSGARSESAPAASPAASEAQRGSSS